MKFKIYEISATEGKERKYIDNGRIFTSTDEMTDVLIDIFHEELTPEWIENNGHLDLMSRFELDVEIIPEVKFANFLNWLFDPSDLDDRHILANNIISILFKEGKITIDKDWLKGYCQYIPASICEGFNEFADPWDDEDLDPADVEIIDIPGQPEEDRGYYAITGIMREDIKSVLSDFNDIELPIEIDNAIDNLSDIEMDQIAEYMSNSIDMDWYWEELYAGIKQCESLKKYVKQLEK
jgi:hypothetical protein